MREEKGRGLQKGLLQRDVYNKQVLIGHVNDVMAHFHHKKLPVILFRHSTGSFMKVNSDDWQISEELRIAEGDLVMNKSHGSIFKEKRFRDLLVDGNFLNVEQREPEKVKKKMVKGISLDGVPFTALRHLNRIEGKPEESI